MIKSYVINLGRDTERMDYMRKRFEELGLEFGRAEAVDGRLMSKEQIEAFCKRRPQRRHFWSPGQVGCFLSHFNVWKQIAQGTDTFYAIFEDDVHVSDKLKDVLADPTWVPEEFDIVRLESSTNRLLLDRIPVTTVHGRCLHRLRSTSWCTGAYIINRACAIELINTPEVSYDVLDYFLFCYEASSTARGLIVYQFSPTLAIQDKFIGKKRGGIGFIANTTCRRLSVFEQASHACNTFMPKEMYKSLNKTIKGFQRVPFEP
jgi:glycosyl transferase family 25